MSAIAEGDRVRIWQDKVNGHYVEGLVHRCQPFGPFAGSLYAQLDKLVRFGKEVDSCTYVTSEHILLDGRVVERVVDDEERFAMLDVARSLAERLRQRAASWRRNADAYEKNGYRWEAAVMRVRAEAFDAAVACVEEVGK